jgi:arylsulfatase A-like enzyme
MKFAWIVSLLFSTVSLGLCQQTNQQQEKKNILFIAVDDLKPLLNGYGHPEMVTPNIDRLMDMGVSFTNAHVQQAVCGPSRASVMTGTYPDRTRVWDLHTDFRESAPDLVSMPEYLIAQGYETTAIGKIYHKGSASEGHDGKSWSIPHSQPQNFDPVYGEPAFWTYQDQQTKNKMAQLKEEAQKKGITQHGKLRSWVMKRLKPSTESCDVSDEAYQDGIYTVEALRKMDQLMETGKPWLLAVGYQKPHLPFVAPKKYWDLYERENIDLAAFRSLSEGTPAFAFHNFGELRSYTDIPSDIEEGEELDPDKQRELIHGYMACVSYIDAQVGRLLDALEEREVLNETLIVLWGDHGFHLGDHTLWCKHSNFEQATRIPLIFAGPGVAKGITSRHPVELVDVFPTLFALSHVEPNGQTQGVSLLPLLDGDERTTLEKDFALHQYPRHGDRMGYSLRTERYRYTEWHANGYRSYDKYDEANIDAVELYDYEKDPTETRNLGNDPKYADVRALLHEKLKDHLRGYEK